MRSIYQKDLIQDIEKGLSIELKKTITASDFNDTEKEISQNITQEIIAEEANLRQVLINQAYQFISACEQYSNKVLIDNLGGRQELMNSLAKGQENYWQNTRPQQASLAIGYLYKNAFSFVNTLDQFMGKQLRKAIIVLNNKNSGNKEESWEIDLEELPFYFNSRGRLKLTKNQLERLRTMGKAINSNTKTSKKRPNNGAAHAYNAVAERLARHVEVFYNQRYYINHLRTTDKDGPGTKGTIAQMEVLPFMQKRPVLMWKKENNKWQYARILNYGTLKEAYMAYLLDESSIARQLDNKAQPVGPHYKTGKEYYSHDFVETFFKHYLGKTDNQAALFGEDVQGVNNQYAIKGEWASLPTIQQYIIAARYIIDNLNKYSKQEIENNIYQVVTNTLNLKTQLQNKVYDSYLDARGETGVRETIQQRLKPNQNLGFKNK